MANQEQVDRLLQGVEGWNQWRKKHSKVIPDLTCANLSCADLSNANLTGADLTCADLSFADLSCADLSNANLTGADLSFASLRGVNLKNANLSNANLTGADLSDANLVGVDLSTVNLSDAEPESMGAESEDLEYLGFLKSFLCRFGIPSESPEPPKIKSARRRKPKSFTRKANEAFCYAHAEMDEHVIVNRVTTIEVVVSREQLDKIGSAASQYGTLKIVPDISLIVQVIPKINFVSVGDDRVKVNPPKKGKPHRLYFDLRATHLGEGEVWVVLRQGQRSLLTLVLRPQIVDNRAIRQAIAAQVISLQPSGQTASKTQRLESSGKVDDLLPPSEPLHQLRIIERRNGTQITYMYELNSPRLEILSLHESKPIASDRYEYVNNLYAQIQSRWLSSQSDRDDFQAELRAFGGKLFDELFPESLQQQLWDYRERIDSIMVISTEPFIPWELVHLKPPRQNRLPSETCFLGQMGLVRWVHDVGFPPKTLRIRSGIHARYVIPSYADPRYRLPQAEQESQFLEQQFGATRVEAQPAQVRQLLQENSFDLLHFAGHGTADQNNIANARLMLEGRVENDRLIPAHLSATTVEQYCNCHGRDRDKRAMVVLNACQIGRQGYSLTGVSGFAQAFLKSGVGVFVGTLWSVGDRPARIFTETLYSSLIAGMTLAEATIAARQQAKQAGDATWLAYVVYGHPQLQLKLMPKLLKAT